MSATSAPEDDGRWIGPPQSFIGGVSQQPAEVRTPHDLTMACVNAFARVGIDPNSYLKLTPEEYAKALRIVSEEDEQFLARLESLLETDAERDSEPMIVRLREKLGRKRAGAVAMVARPPQAWWTRAARWVKRAVRRGR